MCACSLQGGRNIRIRVGGGGGGGGGLGIGDTAKITTARQAPFASCLVIGKKRVQVIPFTPEIDQCRISPCSLTRNMTSHSKENLAFHSLLR